MNETKEIAKTGEIRPVTKQEVTKPIEVTPIELLPQLNLNQVVHEIEQASLSALAQAQKLGKNIDHFVAQFPAGGKMVQQISMPFVKIIVDCLARKNHIIRLLELPQVTEETDKYITVEAKAGLFKVIGLTQNPKTGNVQNVEVQLQTGIGSRRMYFLGKRKDGSTYPIQFPREQAETRAVRKAYTSLVPEDILLSATSTAFKLGKVKTYEKPEEIEGEEGLPENGDTPIDDTTRGRIYGALGKAYPKLATKMVDQLFHEYLKKKFGYLSAKEIKQSDLDQLRTDIANKKIDAIASGEEKTESDPGL